MNQNQVSTEHTRIFDNEVADAWGADVAAAASLLIVSDNAVYAQCLAILLDLAGYEVRTAGRKDWLSLSQPFSPAVVIVEGQGVAAMHELLGTLSSTFPGACLLGLERDSDATSGERLHRVFYSPLNVRELREYLNWATRRMQS